MQVRKDFLSLDNFKNILTLALLYFLRSSIMVVIVKVQDSSGTEIGSFQAEDTLSLAEMAAMHGIEILQSCSTGFCGVCLCEVLEGADGIQKDKT